MNRFDYLHDAPPPFVEALQTARLPRRLHGVAGVIVMLLCVILVAGFVERTRIAAAAAMQARAEARFERSRSELARVQLASQTLETLLERDRRLREIRTSGARVAVRIALTGNLLTPRVWLTAITSESKAHRLKGNAENLPALNAALARLIRQPALGEPELVSVAHLDTPGRVPLVSFDLRLEAPR